MGIHRSGHVIAQPGADWRREEAVGVCDEAKWQRNNRDEGEEGVQRKERRREGQCDYFFSRMWRTVELFSERRAGVHLHFLPLKLVVRDEEGI